MSKSQDAARIKSSARAVRQSWEGLEHAERKGTSITSDAIAGATPTALKAKAGPSSMSTTERYVKLAGVGHFPPTENPEQINALIEEFVREL